ncbi:hypothetical protein BHE74_00002619 [Ensete ventricosum]|nr:hypothetical protein BHE74_00002619 [Ensete ventricosum]
MGGLGKSRLANKIYNCREVGQHFATRGWILVSKDRRTSELLKDLMESPMQIVVPIASNGSRVMVTVCSLDVAKSADPVSTAHELKGLSPAESWELFIKTVFPSQHDDEACPDELEERQADSSLKNVEACRWLCLCWDAFYQEIESPQISGRLTKDGEICMLIQGLSYRDPFLAT